MVSLIEWPEPTVQYWERKNIKLLLSDWKESDFVGNDNRVILTSGRDDLNTFVKENRYNPYYHDEDLYPFDGYAIKVYLHVKDGRRAGICIQ